MPSDKLRQMQADEGEELPMDMSSMIDLVFLLLIFFMVSSHLIIIKIDKNVKPPFAKNALVPESSSGRIVINIYEDGTVRDQEQELPTTEAIQEYVETQRINNDQAGLASRIHLRAHRTVETRSIKRVIKAAGEAGVSDVIFGSYAMDQK